MTRHAHAIRRVAGRLLLAAVLAVGLARCDWAAPAEERQLVVEAFFEAERPLGPIMLRTTQPLDGTDAARMGADGAEVTLQLDGQAVAYRPDEAVPGRYVPETTDTVRTHAEFAFSARWQGRVATARGTVPRPITIEEVVVDVPPAPVEAIFVDSLRRDSLDIPAEQGYIYPVEVTVTWTADFAEIGPDGAYWIRAQLKPYETFNSRVVGFFLQPEAVFRERSVAARNGRRRWRGVYAVPVEAENDPLPPHGLRVTLVRGGADYAAFATSRDDPARREPISNVEGGLGMAVAIALDSVRVEVDGRGAVP